MTIYEIDGFRVYTDNGWYYPEYYSIEMEDFVPFLRADGWEVQFQDEKTAIEYLNSK